VLMGILPKEAEGKSKTSETQKNDSTVYEGLRWEVNHNYGNDPIRLFFHQVRAGEDRIDVAVQLPLWYHSLSGTSIHTQHQTR